MKRFTQVLYTDDDPEDGELFEQALKDTFGKISFHYFESAFHLFRFLDGDHSGFTNILFVDLNMPVKNGLQCILEIRNDKRFQNLPVIVYSTSNQREDVDRCYAAGANLFIKKPVTYREIMEMFGKIFELDWENYSPQPPYSKFCLW
jgi:CheY-like chemotaxis protein